MDEYIIYHEFDRRKLTNRANYNSMIRNASQIIDISNFPDDESAKQYLITNWNLLETQIHIIR